MTDLPTERSHLSGAPNLQAALLMLVAALGSMSCAEDSAAPLEPSLGPGPEAGAPAKAGRADRAQASHPEVHVVYLVPSDGDPIPAYRLATQRATRHLQLWYRDALAVGESFRTSSPTVRVRRLRHDAEWYRTNPNGTDANLWFWFNVLEDGFAATGGAFFDPDDIWVYFIDADPGCGQVTGAAAGVALLPANDLRGLTGETTINLCTGEAEADQGICRWVGGLGHELGHALGLPHPPGCESGSPDCPIGSLMWFGYLAYPDAYFTPAEQAALDQSPFVLRFDGKQPLLSCSGGPIPPLRAGRWLAGVEGFSGGDRNSRCGHVDLAGAVPPANELGRRGSQD